MMRNRPLELFILPLLGMSIAFAFAVGIWFQFLRTEPFDPLTYAPQHVEYIADDGALTVPTVDGYDGPAVRVGDDVPVRGELTVDADGPVDVTGNIVWVSVEPGGRNCPLGITSPRSLTPGVFPRFYLNEMPPCVLREVASLGPSLWLITGKVNVLEPGGVASTWETEPFWIVP